MDSIEEKLQKLKQDAIVIAKEIIAQAKLQPDPAIAILETTSLEEAYSIVQASVEKIVDGAAERLNLYVQMAVGQGTIASIRALRL